MKIFNIRLGLANNSSSSHSLIFLPNLKDKDVEDFEFGWNYFTAASKSSKEVYLANILHHSLANITSKDIANDIIRAWIGPDVIKDEEVLGTIDHQSIYGLPRSWDGKGVDKQFFLELKDFILNEKLAILGGNDNDSTNHPSANGKEFVLDLPRDTFDFKGVARKDPSGFWTIFNRETGAKFRLSFDKKAKAPVKAYSPELVDIKITDFCPYNCPQCYQDSTVKGAHASKEIFFNLANVLGEAKVFEVALGGGEPTLHPNFVEILEKFKNNNIVVNFTTKNLAWLRDEELRPQILKTCGSFAYSIESLDDISNLKKLIDKHEILNQVSVQYVMGMARSHEFESILTSCAENNIPITLLGYKTAGRGGKFTPHDYKNWISDVKQVYKSKYIELRIDTALAEEYQSELKKNKIPQEMYHTKEGKFSLYIDAVSHKMGPSSYCESLLMRRVDLTRLRLDQFIDLYKVF